MKNLWERYMDKSGSLKINKYVYIYTTKILVLCSSQRGKQCMAEFYHATGRKEWYISWHNWRLWFH